MEGLGACTVIATDKTGTLTRNELHVGAVVVSGGRPWLLEGADASPRPLPDEAGSVAHLARTGALCNDATRYTERGATRYLGDAVDVAFLELADRLDLAEHALAERPAIVERIPYEPARRFRRGGLVEPGRGAVRRPRQGAPGRSWCRCAGPGPGTPGCSPPRTASRGKATGSLRWPAARSSRPQPASRSSPCSVTWSCSASWGLIDPVRPEVPGAIADCRRSGVEVKMITGDHPATALTIGRRLGLASDDAEVLAGTDFARLIDGVDTECGPVPAQILRRVADTRISANPLVVLAVVATLALHLFATCTSGFGAVLHVVAPDPALVAAIPLALGLALLFEGYKWLVRRRD